MIARWDEGLLVQLDDAARAPQLLIACDYDGTLAPIVDDPAEAHPLRAAMAALRSLASLPDTHVAVISGRSLRDLALLTRLPGEVHLVGSHGSEFEPGDIGRLSEEQLARLSELRRDLRAVADATPGCTIESKPAGVAFHYRRAHDPVAGEAAARAVLDGLATADGVHAKIGKLVVELSVVDADKGKALERLRSVLSADTIVFIGDDVTDEDAFARLRGPDVGVKVGPGDTLAPHRISDPEAVCHLLGRLTEDRQAWLAGHRAPAIERHSLLSDQRTVALVDPDARISWMCHPRADSNAIFAELLGGPTTGFFAVCPLTPQGPAKQRYLPDTMMVETSWRTVRVTDYLDVSDNRANELAGRSELIRVIEGEGEVEILFSPRVDFGRAFTELEIVDEGVAVMGGIGPILLSSPGVNWELRHDGRHQVAYATVSLTGAPVVLELLLGALPGEDDAVPDEGERRERTAAFWRSKVERLRRVPVAPALVRRSALVLDALRYQPSGAMLAAATTSLPESVGAGRNWDYRFCWPRDSAMSCASLVRLGRNEPGLALLDWVCERVEHATRPDLLRPLYRVTGDDSVPEATVAELAGYAGSRPVRIGNAAENQVQLDALGPVAELIHLIATSGGGLRSRHWSLMEQLADVVVDHWREPDHGIWEVRLARQHNVVSKVMCWLVLDRAVSLAESTGREVPKAWERERDEIVAEVLERGWNADTNSFTAHYEGWGVDAGLLMMGTCGFIDPTDARFGSTIRRIERDLCEGIAVYRYHGDDGLSGTEGGMLICTGWLVQALVLNGRVADAAAWFERLIKPAGPTGLLAEQVDPTSERGLGNFPQAYSHLAVIDSAIALADAGYRG
ncbi:MAG: trehalose-phosphatase [Actinobacteria bacterium]|nr:trehalose-phosphatase [Actinomycetota bacterium]